MGQLTARRLTYGTGDTSSRMLMKHACFIVSAARCRIACLEESIFLLFLSSQDIGTPHAECARCTHGDQCAWQRARVTRHHQCGDDGSLYEHSRDFLKFSSKFVKFDAEMKKKNDKSNFRTMVCPPHCFSREANHIGGFRPAYIVRVRPKMGSIGPLCDVW